MTITAIDAVVTDVVLVTELHGLAARDADLCHIRRTVDRRERGYEDYDDADSPEYTHPGDGVRAPMKYLSHRPTLTLAGPFS